MMSVYHFSLFVIVVSTLRSHFAIILIVSGDFERGAVI